MSHRFKSIFLIVVLVVAFVYQQTYGAADYYPYQTRTYAQHESFVKDGDSFVLKGDHIRLWGIDAVELYQNCEDKSTTVYPCGQLAKNYMKALFDPNHMACTEVDRQDTGRIIATCLINGDDLGQMIVEAGWAQDYTYYSKGHYSAEEERAKSDKRGIWQGAFISPRDWRRDRRE